MCVGGYALDTGSTEKCTVSSLVPQAHSYSLSPFLPCLLGTSFSYTLPIVWRILGLPNGNHLEYSLPRDFLGTPPTPELQCKIEFQLILLMILESVTWMSLHLGSAADLLCDPVSPQPASCQMAAGVKTSLPRDSPYYDFYFYFCF